MALARIALTAIAALVLAACSADPHKFRITDKNKDTFMDEIKNMKGLTVEETRLLIAYQIRGGVSKALGAAAKDPAGKTMTQKTGTATPCSEKSDRERSLLDPTEPQLEGAAYQARQNVALLPCVNMETMNTAVLDEKRYGKLLSKTLPKVIETKAENERMLAVVESLLEKGEHVLTPEEDALLELLTGLIHDFESKTYPIPKSEPHEIVAYLLEARGLQPSDLWQVLGSKSRVSEILSGKRSISKEQAKKLAEFFRVGVELFI
jgi:HTH-type transcriptional regulator/antitoxin HigA